MAQSSPSLQRVRPATNSTSPTISARCSPRSIRLRARRSHHRRYRRDHAEHRHDVRPRHHVVKYRRMELTLFTGGGCDPGPRQCVVRRLDVDHPGDCPGYRDHDHIRYRPWRGVDAQRVEPALAPNFLLASIDTSGRLTISTSNDAASETLGVIGGTAAGGGEAFNSLTASAPVTDPTVQASRAGTRRAIQQDHRADHHHFAGRVVQRCQSVVR